MILSRAMPLLRQCSRNVVLYYKRIIIKGVRDLNSNSRLNILLLVTAEVVSAETTKMCGIKSHSHCDVYTMDSISNDASGTVNSNATFPESISYMI